MRTSNCNSRRRGNVSKPPALVSRRQCCRFGGVASRRRSQVGAHQGDCRRAQRCAGYSLR
jgi:hypothetical protein